MRRFWPTLVMLLACGSSETDDSEPPPQEPKCQPGELTLPDGSCLRAGVPEDACGEGFTAAAEGCAPVLPPEPCGPGLVALPGDSACRPLMDCGAEPWGDVEPEANAEFVKLDYGGASDGSAIKPWVSIQTAIDTADPGAMVIIAAGDYAEDLRLTKPVRLRGRCPDLVSVSGSVASFATVDIRSGASGAELMGIAVRGPAIGVSLSGSEGVRIDRVWIHDTTRGINAQPDFGPTGLILQDVLIESARRYGIFSVSVAAEVDRVVVRSTQIDAATGRGVGALFGLFTAGERRPVAIRRSAFVGNHAGGLFIEGIPGSVESVLVSDTQPAADGTEGFGLVVDMVEGVGAEADIQKSVVERNHDQGLIVAGGTATVGTTTVRDTFPQPTTSLYGRGVNVEVGENGEPAQLVMTQSLVERAWDVGVLTIGAPATLESVLVRDIVGAPIAIDGSGGIGISLQFDPEIPSIPVAGAVRGSRVERALYSGLLVFNADVDIESTLVRETLPAVDGTFGDGLTIVSASNASITDSRAENNARAGLASFGAHTTLSNVMLACNAVDLNGEMLDGRPFSFEDLGGNTCGCPAVDGCKAQTTNLAPPTPQ